MMKVGCRKVVGDFPEIAGGAALKPHHHSISPLCLTIADQS
jgi:hypothetical protein